MFNKKKETKRYKITVEEIINDNSFAIEKIEFETETHDNLFDIVEKLISHPDIDNNDVAQFGVGLKLFSEVMIKNKTNPLFKDLLPHFKDFMKKLKKSGKKG